MSTMTWLVPDQVDVELGESFGTRHPRQAGLDDECLAEDAGRLGKCHRELSLERCTAGERGVVIGVAELVSGGLGRVGRTRPVEQYQRAVVDERCAECAAALAGTWGGIDPLLVESRGRRVRRGCRCIRAKADRTTSTPSSHDTSARAWGNGATRSHHGSPAAGSWPCRRAFARIQRRRSGSAAHTAACIASNVGRLTLLANSEASSGDGQRRRRLSALASPLIAFIAAAIGTSMVGQARSSAS